MTRLVSGKISPPPPHVAVRPWLDALRHGARDRFASVGYPKQDQEEWRLTPLGPITKTTFAPASVAAADAGSNLIGENSLGDDASTELVFIDGRFSPGASRIGELPRGATVCPFAEIPSALEGAFRSHLGRLVDMTANPFVALNTSDLTDGAFIHLSRGVAIEGPVHLMFISTTHAQPVQSHPRVLVVAEQNSEITLVKSFLGERGVHLTVPVTEICAGEDTRINHYRVQRGGDEAFVVSSLAAKLGKGAQFVSYDATLGGRLTRNDLNVVLAGEGAEATLNGLVILGNEERCDNHTLLDHAAANCPSHELYKHVLADRASGAFRGKILVRPGAQKTDAKQTSKSLLLSAEATMNSQPALEIYADDVKCTHGSTTGPVDEEILFYLRSRGVGLEAARHLLTYAFAADVTRRIKVEPVRRRLEDFLAARHGLPRDLRITDLGEHDEKAR